MYIVHKFFLFSLLTLANCFGLFRNIDRFRRCTNTYLENYLTRANGFVHFFVLFHCRSIGFACCRNAYVQSVWKGLLEIHRKFFISYRYARLVFQNFCLTRLCGIFLFHLRSSQKLVIKKYMYNYVRATSKSFMMLYRFI